MDSQAFNAGRTAYQNGDFATAQTLLNAAKAPGEINGAIDHMRGNALMRLGLYADAAQAYGQALQDVSYGKSGALNTNRGRAYLAAGQPDAAVAALTQALSDPEYPTPYKAQVALGEAYELMGQPREAGAAWRNAAIDESNPNPSGALAKLGSCFMELGRPMDAIEAYRTALDFATPQASQNAVYAQLGEAYVAANRMPEAADAFARATADGTYRLTPAQIAAQTACSNAMAVMGNSGRGGETDAMLAAAGYGVGNNGGSGSLAHVDPLDPLGESGEFIPSPEDTGFFEVSEHDIVENARQEAKVQRKKKHTGLKVFVALLVILLIVAGCAVGLYFAGFGWPTQESTVTSVFEATTAGEDIAPYLAAGLSEQQAQEIADIIPSGATVAIDGVDRSMNASTVSLTATLAQGGTQHYLFELVRDGIGWKISSVELEFDSLASGMNASESSDAQASADSSQTSGADAGDANGAADENAQGSGSEDITTTDEAAEVMEDQNGAIEGAVEGTESTQDQEASTQ